MRKRGVETTNDRGAGVGVLDDPGKTTIPGRAENQGTNTGAREVTNETDPVTMREIAVVMTIEIGIGEVDETITTGHVEIVIKHVKLFDVPFSIPPPPSDNYATYPMSLGSYV